MLGLDKNVLQKCEWNDILALQLPFSASRAFIRLESVGLRIVKTIDITFPSGKSMVKTLAFTPQSQNVLVFCGLRHASG